MRYTVPHNVQTTRQKILPAAFYRSDSGLEPVRRWLKGLSKEDRGIIGDDIRTVELGWPVGMPACRPITSRRGLWEVRSNLPGNRIARVIFCIHEGKMILLHGFIKKTEKTSDRDLDLAMKRKREVER